MIEEIVENPDDALVVIKIIVMGGYGNLLITPGQDLAGQALARIGRQVVVRYPSHINRNFAARIIHRYQTDVVFREEMVDAWWDTLEDGRKRELLLAFEAKTNDSHTQRRPSNGRRDLEAEFLRPRLIEEVDTPEGRTLMGKCIESPAPTSLGSTGIKAGGKIARGIGGLASFFRDAARGVGLFGSGGEK